MCLIWSTSARDKVKVWAAPRCRSTRSVGIGATRVIVDILCIGRKVVCFEVACGSSSSSARERNAETVLPASLYRRSGGFTAHKKHAGSRRSGRAIDRVDRGDNP